MTRQASRRELGRPFAALLASTGMANLADGLLMTLLPLIALSLTTSPMQISLLSAAGWLPWLLFGVLAGVVIDRTDRRRAQVLALTTRATLLAVVAALALADQLSIALLIALALAYGTTEVFADLGANAIVPDLVPVEQLARANGRVLGVQQVTNAFLGAPLAALVVGLGAGIGLGASAALAGFAALALAIGLRGDFRKPRSNPDSAQHGQIREGLTFLINHPVVRPLVLISGLLNLASSGYFAVFALWAVGPDSAMGLTEAQYPMLAVGLAIGAVAGSLLTGRVQAVLGDIGTLRVTLTASVVLLIVPVWWPDGWAVAAAFLAIGFTNTIGNVVSQALRQRLVPGELLGRVSGASRTFSYGVVPIGAVLGGLVAEQFGLAVSLIWAVLISLGACAYLVATVPRSAVEPIAKELTTEEDLRLP